MIFSKCHIRRINIVKRFILIAFVLVIFILLCSCRKSTGGFSLNLLKERIYKFYKNHKIEIFNWIKPIFIMFIIYFVGIISIIRANFYYVDDMGRNFSGYSDYGIAFSRYLSDLIAPIIHTDSYLMDISPLTQIIAVLFIAVASVIVLRLITGKSKFSFFEYVSVIPLGLSPYFLQCLSYKYDSPYMALSVLAAVFPLLFYNKKKIIYAFVCIVGMLIVCTTYQASTGIFPMLVILIALIRWHKKEDSKKILEFLILSALWYVVALIIFKLFLVIPIDSYVSTTMPPIPLLIPKVLENFKNYIFTIIADFRIEWIILVALILISMVYVVTHHSKQHKFVALLVSIASLIIMLLVSFGIYLLLEEQNFTPRTMYGFGVLIALMACVIAAVPKAIPAKLICLSLSWMFFVFSFAYGNALFVQKTYIDFRIQRAIDDIIDLDIIHNSNDAKNITIQIAGGVGNSQIIRNMPQDYQILNRLVPITFREDWSWGNVGFSKYYGLNDIIWNDSIDLTKYNLPVLEDNIYHTIKGNEKYILLELKE